jgi:hypothetical protein
MKSLAWLSDRHYDNDIHSHLKAQLVSLASPSINPGGGRWQICWPGASSVLGLLPRPGK